MIGDLTPCMGGFCPKRGACAHYHADSYGIDTRDIAERLCGKTVLDRFEAGGRLDLVQLATKRAAAWAWAQQIRLGADVQQLA